MKLSEYAKRLGIHYTTAHRWYKEGKIPHRCEQLPSGAIHVYYDEEVNTSSVPLEVHLYARVSSHDQKDDIERQMERLRDFCSSNGYVIKSETKEIASGMNANRPKLTKLLRDPEVVILVVENRDRLTRFGFELIKNTMKASGRDIVLLNEVSPDMDLIQDFIDVITSMCSRIYGQRSAKNRIKQIKEVLDK